MYKGKVKWFDRRRGYGFIENLYGGDEYFVHAKSFAQGTRMLSKGNEVFFDIGQGRRGLMVVYVSMNNKTT
jgi:CspA family cold shock protein